MSTRNVYVSSADEPLFARAAELGDGLSPAVATALRAYVNAKEAEMEGFEEVTVKVGDTWAPVERRFQGRRLTRVMVRTAPGRTARYDVYATRRGQLAVHIREESNWNDPATWSGDFDQTQNGHPRLDVYPTVEELAANAPEEVAAAVRGAQNRAPVEVLDI